MDKGVILLEPPSARESGVGEGSIQCALSVDLCGVLVNLLTLIVEDCGLHLQQSPSSSSVPAGHEFKSSSTSVIFLGVSLVEIIKRMYSTPHCHGIFPPNLLLTILKEVDSSFLRNIALQNVAQTSSRRVLSHDAWAVCGNRGYLEIFNCLSEMFHYMLASAEADIPQIVATVVPPELIGGSDRLKVSNVLVATFPLALSMAIMCSSPKKEAGVVEGKALVEKFGTLLEDMLVMCSIRDKVTLATALEASIILFLGTNEKGAICSEDNKEILAVQEYILLPLLNSRQYSHLHGTQIPTTLLGELQCTLLRFLSTASFLSPYLTNVIFPRITENVHIGLREEEENSSLNLLCSILEQFQLTFVNSGHDFVFQGDDKDFAFILYHLQLLVWKWFGEATTTSRLRTSMESLLATFKVMCCHIQLSCEC